VPLVIVRLLEFLNAWLERRSGTMALSGPVVIRDGSAWLRLGPGVAPRWYPTLEGALNA
jgi:hypothetical protein